MSPTVILWKSADLNFLRNSLFYIESSVWQVDVMRFEFLPGKYLQVSEFAFSHTTPNGTEFATKYVKQAEFLAYTSAIEGSSQD